MSGAVLKIKDRPTFTLEVGIPLPDGTSFHDITVSFRHKTKRELEEFVTGDAAKTRPDVDSIMEIVEGWSGLDGEFNRENVTELLQNYHGAARAIVAAYTTKLSAVRLKN